MHSVPSHADSDPAPSERWLRTGWRLIVASIAAGGLLVGVATASTGEPVAVALGAGIAGSAAYVLVRALRAGVLLGPDELSHRGFVRTSSWPKSTIREVASEVVDSKIVYDVQAPVLHLENDSESVLSVLARVQLSERPSRRSQADVAAIQAWLA